MRAAVTVPAHFPDNAPSQQPEALLRRVLVTGSRDWNNSRAVGAALSLVIATGREQDYVIVHGDARGLDRIAKGWAEVFGVRHEPHPADWKLHGKKAGILRNQEMVDLGAEICLAFPTEDSVGTLDCMRRAAKAGIQVINFGHPASGR